MTHDHDTEHRFTALTLALRWNAGRRDGCRVLEGHNLQRIRGVHRGSDLAPFKGGWVS